MLKLVLTMQFRNFQEVTGEKSERTLENMANRYRRFGMAEADIKAAMKNARYLIRPVSPGTYRIVVEMNGMTSECEAVVMKDYWSE